MVLKVVKPLYGIPESGLHWYLTYLDHHLTRLGMQRSMVDPCVLLKRDKDGLVGTIILQVDDSFGVGTETFLHDEATAVTQFKHKPRQILGATAVRFNGLHISKLNDGKVLLGQHEKIEKLQTPSDEKRFASMRALAQYVGVNIGPDICAPVQLVAPGSEQTTAAEFKTLEKVIDFLKDTKDFKMVFTPLKLDTARLVLISDASFANARGLKSQLGYIIALVDDDGNCNIIHWGSNRCRRIARSVLAAEVHGLVLGFDYVFIIQKLAEELLGRQVKVEAYTDSKTLFNVIAKDGATTERRLQIDIFALKESYERGELSRIGWIPGKSNVADALTKDMIGTSSPLWKLLTTNSIDLQPLGWADVAT